MANELEKFRDGLFTKGYRTYGPEIDSYIQLHKDSHNISTGINNGTGPRYGMSPIPGHMHKEAATGEPKPIMQAEDTSDATSYTGRKKILGILPFSFPKWNDQTKKVRHYWFVTQREESGVTYLDFSIASSLQNSDEHQPIPDIAGGLPIDNTKCGVSVDIGGGNFLAENAYNCIFWRCALGVGFSSNFVLYADRVAKLKSILSSEPVNYASSCVISVTGKEEKLNWFMCLKTGTPSSTTAGTMRTNAGLYENSLSIDGISSFGYLPYFFSGKFPEGRRGLTFYALDDDDGLPEDLICIYTAEAFDSTGLYSATGNPHYDGQIDTSPLGTMDVTNTDSGGSITYANIQYFLVNDPKSSHIFQYDVLLTAAKKAFACIIQPGPNNENGTLIQPLDLTESFLPIYEKQTIDYGTSDPYTEDGKLVNTCFKEFTLFKSGVPLASEGSVAEGVSLYLGAPGSGILRSNTVYEITYSWYDKTTGHECNVGTPAKFQTDEEDFVRLCIYRDYSSGGTFGQTVPIMSQNQLIDWQNMPEIPTNLLEIRFYYRALGSYEWLPALFMDACNYFFNPDHRQIWACEGEIAALPGGQPGAFVDYSPLPKDEYIDVKVFNGRAFWFSKKQIVFNLKNDLFSYPTRNIIPATTGDFLGGVVASYPGESDKYERLLVFATDNVYVGQFTGIKAQQPVRVSPYSIANFDVDGSDFVLNAWSSNTAFSHRSACVADGIPYWWGPDGIYKDNGSELPVKVSDEIEPDLHNLYDPNLTDEIHCTYNPATKEIIWFYPPLEDDGYETHGLIFNVRKGEFYPAKWDGKIDWSQPIDISKDESNPHLAGKRVIVGARKDGDAEIQRPYFFDQKNRSGDIFPERELMVKSISEPAADQRRLTLASGYDPTNFATIAQGDYIAIHQGKKYGRSLTDCTDMIARVAAVSTGNGTIDIILPSGASLDTTATLGAAEFFPIWHKAANGPGLHSFPYKALTRYWEPKGVNHTYFWLWLFARFKVNLWPSPEVFKDLTFGYKTPISNPNELIYNTIKMIENTDGHFSLYHQLPFGSGNTQGSAFKFEFSGQHLGNEWVLEYLEMQCQEEAGNHLKMFEG